MTSQRRIKALLKHVLRFGVVAVFALALTSWSSVPRASAAAAQSPQVVSAPDPDPKQDDEPEPAQADGPNTKKDDKPERKKTQRPQKRPAPRGRTSRPKTPLVKPRTPPNRPKRTDDDEVRRKIRGVVEPDKSQEARPAGDPDRSLKDSKDKPKPPPRKPPRSPREAKTRISPRTSGPGPVSGHRQPPAPRTGDDRRDYIPPVPGTYDPEVPPEERTYEFSIKDGTYRQLLEGFSRQTGLGIIGDPPEGKVTFVTTEQMTFQEALNRIRMLLFKYKPLEPYWLVYEEGYLEVVRVVDIYRYLKPEQMFRNEEEYRAADLSEEELALLVYTPKSGSVADFEHLRDFMPDYVRIAPLDNSNTMTIFALVKDINKYLGLIDFFAASKVDDPRTIEKIEVQHITPSLAVERLRALMDLDGGGTAAPVRATRKRRSSAQSPLAPIPEPEVSILPDDAQMVIIVRAMQDKIDEIKMLLPYVDVDTEQPAAPVVIPVEHTDASDLVETVRLILSASEGSSATPTRPKRTSRRSRKRRQKTEAATPTPVTMEAVTLIPQLDTNSIIVVADTEEDLDLVRSLIEQFDVETKVEWRRIELKSSDAEEAVQRLKQLLDAQPGSFGATIVADPAGGALLVTGSLRDVEKVEELLPLIDILEDPVELHIIKLVNQPPSFIASMLREYDGQSAQQIGPAPTAGKDAKQKVRRRRPSRRRGRTTVRPSKFTGDDETGTLYVWCTEKEWQEYLPLIAQLDDQKIELESLTRVPVHHLDVDDAISEVSRLVDFQDVRYIAAQDSMLIMGALDTELEQIRTILAEIDVEQDLVQRTFELKYAEPAEMIRLIETLVEDKRSRPPSRRRPRQKGEKGTPATTISTTFDDLTVVQMNSSLIVRTTPEKMEEIEALINEFDVEEKLTDTRIYDFPPGTNIESMATTMRSVFGGSKPSRTPRRRRKAAATPQSLPMFLPQPVSNRLVIIAEEPDFEEIEELLDILRVDDERAKIETESIPVQYVDAEELVEQIEPLLQFKIRRLIEEGELEDTVAAEAQPQPKRRGRRRVQDTSRDGFYLSADPRNRRIVVAAPRKVIDEAVRLVEDFDRPSAETTIYKTIVLENAAAEEIVGAIRGLMGAPTQRRAAGAKGRKGSPRITPLSGSGDVAFTIVEAPGGGAVFLNGSPEDVAQAEEWIAELDSNSAGGRIIKNYTIDSYGADMKLLVDLIMNVADAGETKTPGRPQRPRRRGGRGESMLEEEAFETSITRTGKDLFVHADLIARTLLVAAPATRIAKVDEIVGQFQDPEQAIGDQPPVPTMMYPLQYAEAFEAAFNLETVLDVYWEPKSQLPQVDYFTFDNVLVIKYPDESRFPEIEELIEKYVDIVDPETRRVTKAVFTPPEGLTAEEAARWLQVNNPDLKINVVGTGEQVEEDHGIERLTPPARTNSNPCVMPLSYQRAVEALTAGLLSQVEEPAAVDEPPLEDEPVEDEPMEELLEPIETFEGLDVQAARLLTGGEGGEGKTKEEREKRNLRGLENEPVNIYYDPETGAIIVEGPAGLVAELSDSFKEMEDQLKVLGGKPDIRVYRVRHISVHEAAAILDEVFNAARREMMQQLRQQQQAERRRQQQLRRQQQQAQRQQAKQGEQQRGAPPTPPGQKPADIQTPITMPQMPGGVQIVPNPRDRTLVMRANTSDYPAILELLATIDQPQPIDRKTRTYVLQKLNATEVEEMLTEILGLDQQGSTSRRQPSAAAGRQRRTTSRRTPTITPSGLPEPIMQETTTGANALGLTPDDITIKANPASNTIFAVAPEAALDYIGKLIEDLENQPIPERITRHFDLVHADANQVAEYLDSYFAETGPAGEAPARGKGRRAAGASASLNAPAFLPFVELNRLTVHATEEQMEETAELIVSLDIETGEGKFEFVTLSNIDAKEMADTLTMMFGGGKRATRRGQAAGDAHTPKFIGDEGSNVLIFSAPEAMREDVFAAVEKIEEEIGGMIEPRIIQLEYANPTEVAEAIEAAYGMGRGGRRKGGAPQARFSVAPHDASNRIYVVADDETFAKVESLARSLDEPAKIGFDFRIYKLEYADARQAYEVLNKLVSDFVRISRGSGKAVPPFSVEVDDKSNALVVLGDETIFGFLEENLPKVDNPANAKSPPGFLMVALKNANAQEVAANITRLWNQRTLPPGVQAPQAEANRSLNMLIVRGTQEQIDEIKKEVIDPMEEYQAPALLTETITLQYAQPEAVAESINQIFEDKRRAYQSIRGQGGVSPLEFTVVVTPDVNTGQVIAQASQENMKLIKARVAELDREEVATLGALKMEIYPIKYADPNAVVNIINQWARARSTSGGRQRSVAARDTVTAVAEWATQSVVVTASEANHLVIEEMINGVDDEDLATQQRKIHVLQLENATAEMAAHQLTQVFRSRPLRRGDRGPSFTSDPNTNAIIASVNAEELAEMQSLLQAIDVPSDLETARTTTPYPLKYAEPGSINNVIQMMFRWDRRTPVSPADQVTSAVDWGTRSVIVTASAKNHEVVRKMIEMVDVESPLKKETYVIKLEEANAEELARALQSVVRNRRSTGRGEQPLTIDAEPATNSLIISATPTEMEELRPMLESLDVPPDATQRQIAVIEIRNADPAGVAQALEEIFVRSSPRGRGGQEPPISISELPGSKAILIKADDADLARIRETIAEIDTEEFVESEIRVVQLLNSDAEELLETVQEYLRKPGSRVGRRGGGAELMGDIRLSAMVQSNSLMISGDKEQVERVESIVKTIDEMASDSMKPQMIFLEYANANDLLPTLEEMFIEQTGRRGGRRGGSTQEPPVIVANEALNSLIVRASPADFTQIQGTVAMLDTPDNQGPPMMRIIRLAEGVNVNDMAEKLEDLFEESIRAMDGGGRRGRRGGGREKTIAIEADTRTHSLLVSGSPELFDEVEQTVRALEGMGPLDGRTMRIIKPTQFPAEEVQDMIERLKEEQSGSSSSSRSRSSRGGRRRR
jgi:type II secretory pathway component GspD/PulD (secretin)